MNLLIKIICVLLVIELTWAQSNRNNNNNKNNNLRFSDIVDDIIRKVIRNGRLHPNTEDIRAEINRRFSQLSIIESFLNDQTNFDAFSGISFVLNDDATRLTPGSFQQKVREELDPLKRIIPQFDNPTISNQIRERIENIIGNGVQSSKKGRTGSSIRLSSTLNLDDLDLE